MWFEIWSLHDKYRELSELRFGISKCKVRGKNYELRIANYELRSINCKVKGKMLEFVILNFLLLSLRVLSLERGNNENVLRHAQQNYREVVDVILAYCFSSERFSIPRRRADGLLSSKRYVN
ncbi:MAG: hypothetical protein AAF717_17575 [Bacteroidota bacterium]